MYAVIEVNAAPGLEHYAALGATPLGRVRDLYVQLLGAPEVG